MVAVKSPVHQSGTFNIGGDRPIYRLGFGAMRITGKGIWGNHPDPEQCKQVLKRAIELGVNFIDTADSYGPEVSENLIAEALYPYPSDLVIATKGGMTRQGPDRWLPVGRPEYLTQCVEMSLRRLKLETIDLYQFHRIDPKVPLEESLAALQKMQIAGKIRHIGLSNFSVADLEKASQMIKFVSVQNLYNLSNRTSEDILHYCEKHGIGFIPWFPLECGNLSHRSTLEQLASRKQATPAQIALAWLLNRSRVMLPIPGTASLDHLEENCAAGAIELSEEEIRSLES